MVLICRLCLEIIGSNSYEPIDKSIYKKINDCITTLESGLSTPQVLCSKCSNSLKNAYEFKLNCLKTEERIKTYFQKHNVVKVDLNDVLTDDDITDENILLERSSNVEYSIIDDDRNCSLMSEMIANSEITCIYEEMNCGDTMKLSTSDTILKDSALSELRVKNNDDVSKNYSNGEIDSNDLAETCWTSLKENVNGLLVDSDASILNQQVCVNNMFFKARTKQICIDCGESFYLKTALSIHSRIHSTKKTNGKTYSQHESGTNADNVQKDAQKADFPNSFLDDAMNINKSGTRKVIKQELQLMGNYYCELCNVSFVSCKLYTKHVQSHNFQCNICGKLFETRSILLKHESECHNLPAMTGKYKCSYCDKSYYTLRALERHARLHPGAQKQYMCEICGMSFDMMKTFQWHKEVKHIKKYKVECDVCGLECPNKASLRIHMRTHNGEKPYSCEHCGKNFAQHGTLRYHLKFVHDKEKSFACTKCPMTFKYGVSLQRHVHQQHEKNPEKKYTCNLCNKSFLMSVSLNTHRRRHTVERKHQCKVCEKAFLESSALNRHIMTHTGEKPFECHLCGFRCNQRYNLRLHIKSHDKKKIDI